MKKFKTVSLAALITALTISSAIAGSTYNLEVTNQSKDPFSLIYVRQTCSYKTFTGHHDSTHNNSSLTKVKKSLQPQPLILTTNQCQIHGVKYKRGVVTAVEIKYLSGDSWTTCQTSKGKEVTVISNHHQSSFYNIQPIPVIIDTTNHCKVTNDGEILNSSIDGQ